MSQRKRGWIIGGVSLVLLAGALLWWSGVARAPAPAIPRPAARLQAELPVVDRGPEVANLRAAQSPLPQPGTPLRLVFDSLKQRAGGGDARAGCRLAAELEQCERVRMQLGQFDDQLVFQQDRLDREADPQQRARLQQGIDRFTGARGAPLLQQSEHCEGVPLVSPAERANLWRAAALGGSLPALTQYAVGNAFRTRDTLQLLPQLLSQRSRKPGDAGHPTWQHQGHPGTGRGLFA